MTLLALGAKFILFHYVRCKKLFSSFDLKVKKVWNEGFFLQRSYLSLIKNFTLNLYVTVVALAIFMTKRIFNTTIDWIKCFQYPLPTHFFFIHSSSVRLCMGRTFLNWLIHDISNFVPNLPDTAHFHNNPCKPFFYQTIFV